MAITRWIPLESNPDVLNRFASVLGLDVSKVTFSDVYGLDPVNFAVSPYLVMSYYTGNEGSGNGSCFRGTGGFRKEQLGSLTFHSPSVNSR